MQVSSIAAIGVHQRSPGAIIGSEGSAGLELPIARLDLIAGEGAEAIDPELFAAETAHHGAVDHGAPQFVDIDLSVRSFDAAAREVADEASGEAVAGAGRVEDVFEQVARSHKVTAASEKDGAILSAFDDQRMRSHVE